MPSVETRRGRRILGSIEAGAELMATLAAICRQHDVTVAEVRASGRVESVELDVLDRATDRHHPSRIGGGLELLSLHGVVEPRGGEVRLAAKAVLVRLADPSLATIGGQLRSAAVTAVEFVIEAHDDVLELVARGRVSSAPPPLPPEPRTPRPLPEVTPPPEVELTPPPEPRPPPPEPRTPPPEPRTPPPARRPSTAVVEAPATPGELSPEPTLTFRAPSTPPPVPDEVALAPGDVVLHPRFQRCLVTKVESNHEYIQVQLKNGRVVRLSLEILSLTPRGVENGQRVFQAAIAE